MHMTYCTLSNPTVTASTGNKCELDIHTLQLCRNFCHAPLLVEGTTWMRECLRWICSLWERSENPTWDVSIYCCLDLAGLELLSSSYQLYSWEKILLELQLSSYQLCMALYIIYMFVWKLEFQHTYLKSAGKRPGISSFSQRTVWILENCSDLKSLRLNSPAIFAIGQC